MGFMDFFRKKNSGEVAKDRLKLLLDFRPRKLFSGNHGSNQK